VCLRRKGCTQSENTVKFVDLFLSLHTESEITEDWIEISEIVSEVNILRMSNRFTTSCLQMLDYEKREEDQIL
jgi:hypothetical protein